MRAVDLAVEAEAFGAPADPPAGRLAGADVVLLGAAGDGVEVVVGPTRGELADAQHDAAPPPHGPRRPGPGTDGASASWLNGMHEREVGRRCHDASGKSVACVVVGVRRVRRVARSGHAGWHGADLAAT